MATFHANGRSSEADAFADHNDETDLIEVWIEDDPEGPALGNLRMTKDEAWMLIHSLIRAAV